MYNPNLTKSAAEAAAVGAEGAGRDVVGVEGGGKAEEGAHVPRPHHHHRRRPTAQRRTRRTADQDEPVPSPADQLSEQIS